MEQTNKNINELISKLIKELDNLKNINTTSNLSKNGDIEVEDVPGTPIKINSKEFYKLIYKDVNNLKKDTESLLNLYLDHVKPTLKSVDENVKMLNQNFKSIEQDIIELKKNRPKKFSLWLEEKRNFVESMVSFGKFIFWIIAFFWLLSTALPNLLNFIILKMNRL